MCEPTMVYGSLSAFKNAARGQRGQANKTYTSDADKNAYTIVCERGQLRVHHSPNADKKTSTISYLLIWPTRKDRDGERGGLSPIGARGRQRSVSTAQRSPSGKDAIERMVGRSLAFRARAALCSTAQASRRTASASSNTAPARHLRSPCVTPSPPKAKEQQDDASTRRLPAL
jgi:hypothetical protein